MMNRAQVLTEVEKILSTSRVGVLSTAHNNVPIVVI